MTFSTAVGSNIDQDAFDLKRMMRLEAHEKAFEVQVSCMGTQWGWLGYTLEQIS